MKHKLRQMLPVLAITLLMTTWAAPKPSIRNWLIPKLHFIYGYETGEPVQMFFQRTPIFEAQKLEIKNITVTGLKVKSWQLLEAFGKALLELDFEPKPDQDVNFSSIQITHSKDQQYSINVGPNRVIYLKPKAKYEINIEITEQVPNDRLFLGLRAFNDSSQSVTILRILYAPNAASTNQILLNPAYDSDWFDKLAAWSQVLVKDSNVRPKPPAKSKYVDASKLNLKIPASRGFSAAIVEPSLQANFSCLRASPAKKPPAHSRRDNAFLQSVIEYRVGNGPKQLYPVPDNILVDVCP